MTRVCHLSSAHLGLDTRIFHKQCVSLAQAGFDTHLVIMASAEDIKIAANKNVKIHPLNIPSGRFSRMIHQAWNCYNIGRKIKADVYHFHDPELIPYGILLSLTGKKVIYDAHEDVPKDILTKDWIAPWIRKTISCTVEFLEYIGARYFFSVVAATPFIEKRFKKITPNAIDINNYSRIDDFLPSSPDWFHKHAQVCYVGGINRIRGILQVVQAMSFVTSEARLQLGGKFSDPDFETLIHSQEGWLRVDGLGWLNRDEVRSTLERSMAGLVTLPPTATYLDSLPVKMFEYMAAGLPVIASNFPLWREIIEANDCGLCVDPLDPTAIANAIDHFINHPTEAERMGKNGRTAVREKYNWHIEEIKLLRFYEKLTCNGVN